MVRSLCRLKASRKDPRHATLHSMSVLVSTPPPCPQRFEESPKSAIRVGAVSFLNTRPLVAGLEHLQRWSIQLAPPSQLVHLLADDEVDLALCSSVDLLTAPFDVAWLASTPLACSGETLTVRLFSKVPIDELTEIHCDTDSHTSIALLKVLCAEHWKIDVECVPLGDSDASARLLIGDKVVDAQGEEGWPVQVDLGQAWKDYSGLPFVFAVWMGRSDRSELIKRAGRVIDHQYRLNRHRLPWIVARESAQHGWASEEAHGYLTEHIQYGFAQPEMDGLMLFLELCRKHRCAPDCDVPPPITF